MIRHGNVAIVAGVARQTVSDSESTGGPWPVSDAARVSASASGRRICNRCGRVGTIGFWQDRELGLVCRNLIACVDRAAASFERRMSS